MATQKNLYGAFGDSVITEGSSDNNRMRNTKERDSSTGLDDDGFRYYDPSTGRYIQREPSGYSDGLNAYLSDHDDPVNKYDPTGLNVVTEDQAKQGAQAWAANPIQAAMAGNAQVGRSGVRPHGASCSAGRSESWAGAIHERADEHRSGAGPIGCAPI